MRYIGDTFFNEDGTVTDVALYIWMADLWRKNSTVETALR